MGGIREGAPRVKIRCRSSYTRPVLAGSVSKSPPTRPSLLVRIRDADDAQAWSEFVALYAPLIHGYAMRRGLQDADAADIAQEVLGSVSRAIEGFEYDSNKGKFRGWLFQVTRNQVYRKLTKNARTPSATGDTGFASSLAQQPDPSSEEEAWNREHEKRVFRWATKQAEPEFQPSTWQAFWSVAVEGVPAAKAAESLGVSVGAVYIAKSRVTARLRELIDTLEE